MCLLNWDFTLTRTKARSTHIVFVHLIFFFFFFFFWLNIDTIVSREMMSSKKKSNTNNKWAAFRADEDLLRINFSCAILRNRQNVGPIIHDLGRKFWRWMSISWLVYCTYLLEPHRWLWHWHSQWMVQLCQSVQYSHFRPLWAICWQALLTTPPHGPRNTRDDQKGEANGEETIINKYIIKVNWWSIVCLCECGGIED